MEPTITPQNVITELKKTNGLLKVANKDARKAVDAVNRAAILCRKSNHPEYLAQFAAAVEVNRAAWYEHDQIRARARALFGKAVEFGLREPR